MSQSNAKKEGASAHNTREPHLVGSPRRRLEIALLAFGLAVLGTLWMARAEEIGGKPAALSISSAQRGDDPLPAKVSTVFTPAHQSVLDAIREFLFLQSASIQPIAFNHKVHLQHDLQCTSCHVGVTQGPDAGIPSVTFCMACHQVIAADRPEIKKLAGYAAEGQEVPWQPVFWFYPTAHVRFWHAPHIHAGVSCEQCHGDMSQRTVAVKTFDLSMNFCLTCHKAKGVSVDCTTCHY